MMTAQQEQGVRLKAAREAAKLTQAQVTERLGYGANTLSQYERGDIGISDERLVQLAGLYGVEPERLAGRPLTFQRDAAFYDGILHSLAVFNRASGELIAEVQAWRAGSQERQRMGGLRRETVANPRAKRERLDAVVRQDLEHDEDSEG